MRVFVFCVTAIVAACSVAAADKIPDRVKLEGQIVCCRDCWAKADRRTVPYGTSADLMQAAQCIGNGDPTLLAVMNPAGATEFYQLEAGQYKRPGKNWLDYVGKRVEVTGSTRSKRNVRYIRVDVLTVLSSPEIAAEVSPQSVAGTEAELVLKDLFGNEQRLSAYRGRIVVLNFWATYCIPCRKEMPDLASIQNEYAAFGVQVIGASADDMSALPKVRQFIRDTRLNFPVLIGASASDMERFGLGSALPGTVVIGRDGKIVASIRGVIKPAELKKQIEGLLAQAGNEQQLAVSKDRPAKASSVPS